MTTTKRIVCLANSRKLSGRCVAGREMLDTGPGEWIRPVSSRSHQEVSERERQYQDGADPRVGDLILVPLLNRQPSTFQQENWLLDPTYYWSFEGRMKWPEMAALSQEGGQLWINGHHTFHGRHDKIPQTLADELKSSLTVIRVAGLDLTVLAPSEAFGNPKRRVQARFEHAGTEYRFWVTDPDLERSYLQKQNDTYRLGESLLTISLGEPFEGHTHKLVAAVIRRPRIIRRGTRS
ncbi:dual OB domain-containing protein [Ilumatobacter sp.]|uniref:dual OB domain-containing protein n=1 Tax=Ilumatobacter sp. TaxID=1967498 RepID=UPI0037531EF6